ncbi:MAG TPA: hypothetical protein VJR58_01470 [Vineibacter sp.]|nr:hypothetical protein [Vineibacter sp.]
MPINWSLDHDSRLITAKATGAIGTADFEAYFKAVTAEGGVGYRAIFSLQAAGVELRLKDLAALSQEVKDRVRDDVSDGWVAIVVTSDAEREMGAYFIERLGNRRPCRMFDSIEAARAWLGLPPE